MYSLLREPAEPSTSTARGEIDNLLSRIQQLEAITNGTGEDTITLLLASYFSQIASMQIAEVNTKLNFGTEQPSSKFATTTTIFQVLQGSQRKQDMFYTITVMTIVYLQ